MNKIYLTIGASVVGAGVSFFAGWKVAELQLNKYYNEQMEAEIARTKAFYAGVSKKNFPSPQDYAESIDLEVDVTLEEAVTAVRKYQGKEVLIVRDGVLVPASDDELEGLEDEEDAKLEEALIEQNVFQDEGENIVTTGRTPEVPYQITALEFAANDPNHDQIDVTWYAGDNVLADENDRLVDDHKCIGDHNLELFGTGQDPNVVLVRNERLKVDYAVARSMGKFAHEVLGLRHSDETYERIRRPIRSADE